MEKHAFLGNLKGETFMAQIGNIKFHRGDQREKNTLIFDSLKLTNI